MRNPPQPSSLSWIPSPRCWINAGTSALDDGIQTVEDSELLVRERDFPGILNLRLSRWSELNITMLSALRHASFVLTKEHKTHDKGETLPVNFICTHLLNPEPTF